MRVSLVGLIEAAAVITVVFSIVTSLPIDFHGIQLFTHFRSQYLIVSILLLLLFKWLPNPWIIGALGIAVLINAAYVLPWYFDKHSATNDHELKILHANVFVGNSEYERLFKLVDTEQPDVIVLQEISPEWEAELQVLQQAYPFTHIEARDNYFGVALLSRRSLTSIKVIESPPLGFPTIVADIAVSERTLHLVTTHPIVPLGRQLYAARNKQLESIPELLESTHAAKLLIGDLNISMWDMHYRALEDATGLRNARVGFGIVPTWPAHKGVALIPIDHVLISDVLSVKEIRSASRIGSDHLPLIVTVTL